MSFWKGEFCKHCEHKLVERQVTLHRKVKGKRVLIENVPAGICPHCGARFFAANLLKTIQESLRGRVKEKQQVSVSVDSL